VAVEGHRSGDTATSNPTAIDACKRVLGIRARDLHDVALKSAMALELFRLLKISMTMDAIILTVIQDIIRAGTVAAPVIEATPSGGMPK
jgi:hypothetical protein